MTSPELSPLLRLPSELIHHILGYLDLSDLLTVSLVSRALQEHAQQDTLWQRIVEAETCSSIPSKKAGLTWRGLFKEHHPYWFLVQRKIWFADTAHTGRLIIARYDHRINAIEAYSLVAERQRPNFQTWDYNPDVIIHTFSPRVQLDLNAPVLRLDSEAYDRANVNFGARLQREIPMMVFNEVPDSSARLYSSLMLTRPWPSAITTGATPVWPPLVLPSDERARNDAVASGYRHAAHKPARMDQLSRSTFRLRRWMEFASRPHGFSMRMGEDISTWATLPEQCYTPTPQKPWQGIWCGDYSGHGCEFLVIMQPDRPAPLPERAEWVLRAQEREESVSSSDSWSTAPTNAGGLEEEAEFQTADDLEDSVAALSAELHERESSSRSLHATESTTDEVYRGRLEAVKLTGDPNIPRGEFTFIAPEIGSPGLLRVASEDQFKGARVVRSVGHIAAMGFRDDNYMVSQLILISHDRLAQYWEAFGHVSFYERVDIDRFTKV